MTKFRVGDTVRALPDRYPKCLSSGLEKVVERVADTGYVYTPGCPFGHNPGCLELVKRGPFRVGDRVRHSTGNVGVIALFDLYGDPVVAYDEGDLAGRALGALVENLRLVEDDVDADAPIDLVPVDPEPAYVPQPGDKVKVTLVVEGEIDRDGDLEYVDANGGEAYIYAASLKLGTVELVEKAAPPKPKWVDDDVVYLTDAKIAYQRLNGEWYFFGDPGSKPLKSTRKIESMSPDDPNLVVLVKDGKPVAQA